MSKSQMLMKSRKSTEQNISVKGGIKDVQDIPGVLTKATAGFHRHGKLKKDYQSLWNNE